MPAKRASRKMSKKRVTYAKNGNVRGKYKGKGDYTYANPGPFGSFGRIVGGLAGAVATGHPVGYAVGQQLGGLMHYPAKKYLGSGDYISTGGDHVIAPTPPSFGNDKEGTVICHREYLGDLITSATAGGLKIDSFNLNVGDEQCFPWLSQVCKTSYQQYKLEGCVFEFKSFSADALNSTNTALGSVFAAVNYDYTDADLGSRAQIENCDWSNSSKPSESFIVPVECKPKMTGLNGGLLYVLNQPNVPANADPKTYYLGKVFFGTLGFQGTSVNCGSIYVTYKVRLMKPIMSAPLSNAHFVNLMRTGATDAAPLGTATVATSDYTANTLNATFTGTVMTIPRKFMIAGARYLMILSYVGSSTAALVCPAVTSTVGLTLTGAWNSWVNDALYEPVATGVTATSCSTTIEWVNQAQSNVDGSITFAACNPPDSCTCQIYITQRNGLDSALLS